MMEDRQCVADASPGKWAFMNIAYLCADRGVPVLGDKGASVHVREFVTALAGMGHEITLLCANRGTGNDCPPIRLIELPPDDDPVTVAAESARLSIPSAARDATLHRELGKLACDRGLAARVLASLDEAGLQPDAIYECYSLFHRAGGDVAKSLKIPRVLEMNAPLVEEQERFRGLRLKSLAEETETETLCRADHVVAVSAAVKECALSRGVPSERVTVLPNGVDTARFHPGVNGLPVRQRYGLVGKQVIGFVGSLKPWHGLDFLLDAFEQITAGRLNAVLLVVGEGPRMPDLRARVAREKLDGRVILAGRVPHAEIPGYFAAMDLTVAPYIVQDCFYFSPLKVVESLAAGRPVVAPRLGQLSDLIEDGVTGLLYPPGDLAAFTACLHRLLANPAERNRMAVNARQQAERTLSWESVVHRALAIIEQLSQHRGGE